MRCRCLGRTSNVSATIKSVAGYLSRKNSRDSCCSTSISKACPIVSTASSAPIAANEHIGQAIALIEEQSARFPKSRSIDDWALLKNRDPAGAAKALDDCNRNVSRILGNRIALQLAPLNGGAMLHHYWLAKANGDAEGAEAIKVAAIGEGFPWPGE